MLRYNSDKKFHIKTEISISYETQTLLIKMAQDANFNQNFTLPQN